MEQGLVPRSVGEAKTRLEVVLVRRAGGDEAVAHQTASVRSRDLSSLERSGFIVPPQTGVHGQFARELPCVLDIEAVNVVLGCDLSRTKCDSEAGRRVVGGVGHVLSKVELREQRIPRIVADVEPKLARMCAV